MRTTIGDDDDDREPIARAVDALWAIASELTACPIDAERADETRVRWLVTDALAACMLGVSLVGARDRWTPVPLAELLDDLPVIFEGLLDVNPRVDGFAVCEFTARCGDVLRAVTRLGLCA